MSLDSEVRVNRAFFAILTCGAVVAASGVVGAFVLGGELGDSITAAVGVALILMVAFAVRAGERWSRLFVIWTGAGVAVAGPPLSLRTLSAMLSSEPVATSTWLFDLVALPVLSVCAGVAAWMLTGARARMELERRRGGRDSR